MPDDYGIWSLLPPILAITLAIATRQVHVSLFAGSPFLFGLSLLRFSLLSFFG